MLPGGAAAGPSGRSAAPSRSFAASDGSAPRAAMSATFGEGGMTLPPARSKSPSSA